MQNITIRALTAADAPAFVKLWLHGLRKSPAVFGSAYEQARKIPAQEHRKRLDTPRKQGVTIGAFSGGLLIGIGGLAREESLKRFHKAWLWGMYVHPEYRGLGTALAIVEKLMETAREMKGLLIIKLAVTSTNAAAIKLYKNAGFHWYGSEPKAMRVNGQFYDFDYMMIEVARWKPARVFKSRQKPNMESKQMAAKRRKKHKVTALGIFSFFRHQVERARRTRLPRIWAK